MFATQLMEGAPSSVAARARAVGALLTGIAAGHGWRRRRGLSLLSLVLAVLLGPAIPAAPAVPVHADDITPGTIVIRSDGLRPAQVSIAAGQAVTWLDDADAAADLVSDTAAWSTVRLNNKGSWSFTFSAAGSYPFHATTTHDGATVTYRGSVSVSGASAGGSSGSTPTATPPPGSNPPAGGASVSISNFSFQPGTLTLPVGATVTWTNHDTDSHTTTSDGGVWDSGRLGTGGTFSFTFSQAGTFAYHCAYHSNMRGTIVVSSANGGGGGGGGATPPTATATATTPPTATATAPSNPPAGGSAAVTITNFSFQPDPLNVPVGTTVTWTNRDPDSHTATSDTGVWDSGRLGSGGTFSFTFAQPGTFTYHCAYHSNMHGTIVVGGAATTPTVPLTTTPTPTATLPATGTGAGSTVSILNFAFQPATLTVPVGATVTWTNSDPDAHTATSDTGVWDSSRLAQGASFSFTFAQAGTFAYHCTYHSNMHGTIVVGAGGASASPTATLEATPTPTPTTQTVAAAGGNATVTIANYAYQPATLNVPLGTKVTWTNTDTDSHTVTSDNPGFDSNRMGQGATFSYTFSQPGTYAYHCAYHSNMHGTVVVGSAPTGGQLSGQLAAAAAPAAPPLVHDERYFAATGYRIDDDDIADYFRQRGGVDVFGLPVSRTFTFLGCKMQLFQRKAAQVCPGQEPDLMNLLDPGFPPFIEVNGSTLPAPDPDLKNATPRVGDPDYATAIIDFVRANAPDTFEGEPVNFGQTFFASITADMVPPDALDQIDLLNLEVWGAPISRPARDPSNPNFIYQRFQRGIMHYDATTGATRGILLADYLKQILMASPSLPADLLQESQSTRYFGQYCPTNPGWLCRPDDLPGTDLTFAFAADLSASGQSAPAVAVASGRAASVAVVDFAFQPATLTVTSGTTVRWTNRGRLPHTVTDASGNWGSDLLRTGQSFEQRFDAPGTYTYLCSVHASMQGTIVVADS